MTIAEHRRLGEALKGTDIAGIHPTLKLLCDAARLTYDRWQECGECGGKGDIEVQDTGHFPWTCNACKGRGIRPNQTRLEQAQSIVMDTPTKDIAEAVVRAFEGGAAPNAEEQGSSIDKEDG